MCMLNGQKGCSQNTNVTLKNRELTQHCKKHERVRAATAALTIVAARELVSPILSASPAMNCLASSSPT